MIQASESSTSGWKSLAITLLLFGAVFIFSSLLLLYILETSFLFDNRSGEPTLAHPMLSQIEFLGAWASIVFANILVLKMVYGADGKMRGFSTPVLPTSIAARILVLLCPIIYQIVIYFLVRLLTSRVVSHLRFSPVTGHFFVPNPIEVFLEALMSITVSLICFVLFNHYLNGLVQKEGEVVPYVLKFVNVTMTLMGYMSFIGWTSVCLYAMLPSYNVIPIVYVAISTVCLSLWFSESAASGYTVWQWLTSFAGFLMTLMTFLTRLSQVLLVFLPLNGFSELQRHLLYFCLLFIFGNCDVYSGVGGVKGDVIRRCCNPNSEPPPPRTWGQFFCGLFHSMVRFLLTLYRTVWVFILIVPGLHSAALTYSPGRLTLQIFSIWNLLNIVLSVLGQKMKKAKMDVMKQKMVEAAAGPQAAGYVPLSGTDDQDSSLKKAQAGKGAKGQGDIEMCAPAAVVVSDHDKRTVGEVVTSINLL